MLRLCALKFGHMHLRTVIEVVLLLAAVVCAVFSSLFNPLPVFIYPPTPQLITQLPHTSSNAAFTFVFIGSGRVGDATANDTLRVANAQHPMFILDSAYASLAGDQYDYNRLAWTYRHSAATVLTIPMPHAATGLGRLVYTHSFSPTNPMTGRADYTFDFHATRFVIIDDANGNLTSHQVAWLQSQLAVSKRTIIAMAISPFSNTGETTQPRSAAFKALLTAIEQHRVDLVLIGQTASSTSQRIGSTQFLSSSDLLAKTPPPDHDTSSSFAAISVTPADISYRVLTSSEKTNPEASVVASITGIWILLGWCLFGLFWRLSRLRTPKPAEADRHRRSYGFMPAVTFYLIIGLAISLGSWSDSTFQVLPATLLPLVQLTGSLIFGLGLAWAIWARRTLGQYWSASSAVVRGQHKVVQVGPYAHVRHPIYTGEMLMALGSGIWSANWILLVVLFGGIALYDMYRARIEETVLAAELGEEYRLYQQQSSMFVPMPRSIRTRVAEFPSRR